MATFKMKCPECSHEFTGDSTIEQITCPSCNKEISVNKAIKYYQSLNKLKTEKKLVAQGEIYAKVDALIEESKWYVENDDFDKALELTDEALTLSNVDSRIYMMRVYAKTKNFTDYTDTTHYSDLKKALDLSPVFEKEKIRELYAPYYKKTKIPEEEMREYENQEASSRLGRVENLLKDSIPNHFKRKDSLKPTLIATSIMLAVAVVLMILSFALDVSVLSLIGAAILLIDAFFFIKYIDNKKQIRLFDAVLDFYDGLDSFELEPNHRLKVSAELEKLAVAQINGESTLKNEQYITEFLVVLIEGNNQKANDFILKNKTFSKYLSKN